MKSSRWLAMTLAVVLAGIAITRPSEASNLAPWVQIGMPSARISVLDPLRDRLIMFDGVREPGVVNAWSLATSKTTTIPVAGTAPRFDAIQYATYDAPSDRIVVVTTSWFAPTALWSFNLSGTPSWSAMPLGGTPYVDVGFAFDTKRRRVIAMGGAYVLGGSRSPRSTVLAYSVDLGSVETITTVGPVPAARWGHSLIYDSRRDRLIAYGGWTRPSNDDRVPDVLVGDVWELPLTGTSTWRQITGAEPRAYHTAIYDSLGDRMVVYGGQDAARAVLQTLLTLDLGSTVSSMPTQGPDARYLHSALYDARGNRMIVHGGSRGGDGALRLEDVWSFAFDRLDWSDLSAGQIGPRQNDGWAFIDVVSGDPIFIGVDYTRATERWRLGSDDRWSSQSLGVGPIRYSTAIADPARERYLFFGGQNGNATSSELWEFRDRWRQIFTSGEPEPRTRHSAVYDPIGERMIIYGGYGNPGTQVDQQVRASAWALSLRGFPEWSPLPGLRGRAGHVAVYDTRRDRMIVFGGETGHGDYLNETWALSGREGWVQLEPTGSAPGAVAVESAAYDSLRDEMVALTGDGTVYRLAFGVPHWTREEPPIKPLMGGFAVLDLARGRAVAHGEASGGWVQTWKLELGCPAVEFAPPSLGDGVLGRPYRARVTTGATTGSLALTSGALPAGLAWNAATGEISGVPSVTGTFAFTLSLTTAKECAYQREYALVVRPCLAPTSAQVGLEAERVVVDEAGAGLAPLRLTFTVPGDAWRVEVYRAGFGNYPEYDDSVLAAPRGSPPAAPGYPPGAPWVRVPVVSSPGVDVPPVRDFWSYVAFAIDSCDNASSVSAVTAALPNYRLGDVAGASGDCAGDGRVTASDLDLFARHYGVTLSSPGPDPLACMDIGPTTTGDARGRPLTDDRVDFEDLVVLALDAHSAPRPGMEERPLAVSNQAWLDIPAAPRVGETFVATLHASATGTVRAARFQVEYDASVVEWAGFASGELLARQSGPARALSPRAGAIDLAVLGANLEGSGELARFTFRLLRDAPVELGLVALEARGDLNQRVDLASGDTEQRPPSIAALTCFPNPSPGGVSLRMSLPHAGTVDLSVFDVQGRWVRSLVRGVEAAGQRLVFWDGRDDDGAAQPPGLYVARLVTESGVLVRRVALIP